jgi:hypothetical protein
MSKHTPGPWTIKRDETADERGLWIIEYRDLISEEKYGFKPWMGTIAKVGGPYDKGEANVSLIAAAPELLEALKEALPYIEDSDADSIFGKMNIHKIKQKIEVAIAKAEGRKTI